MRALLALLSTGILAAGWGCAASQEADSTDGSSSTDPASSGNGGAGAAGGGGGSPASSGNGGSIGIGGSGVGGGEPGPALLYVHTDTTLFTADAQESPLTLTEIGDFDCVGGDGQDVSMTDLAVNAAGEVWGISKSNVYRFEVQGSTVHCADTIPLENPDDISFYGMAIVPPGILGAAEVLLAANSAGELWSIDDNGALSRRGTFGKVPADDGNGHTFQHAGQDWELSGDIVISANDGDPVGFATVRDCPDPPSANGCNEVDTLIEIDVDKLVTSTTQSVTKSVRGKVLKASGCSDTVAGYGRIYGIAAYQGSVFGFSRGAGDGFAVEISNQDGYGCLVQAFSGNPWSGAGITTLAPVDPPPPK
jgi:hypothetical protein